jgi:hypothetical protein
MPGQRMSGLRGQGERETEAEIGKEQRRRVDLQDVWQDVL